MSRPSSNSRRSGFTIVELLVAIAILGIVLGIISATLMTSMRVKGREIQLVDVQQNLRSALQLITQDIRGGAFFHVWNDPACANGVCSDEDRIAVVTTDGVMTAIPEPPGSSYNNSAITGVCDARQFRVGDLAIVFNGDQSADLIEITGINLHADHSKPCKGPPGAPNRDQVQHNKDKLSGAWSTTNHMFRAVVATYSLQADPADPDATVLYRRTGLRQEQEQSGIVAFHVSDLDLAYGIPADPTAAASELIFYPTLTEAAAALGPGYSANPRQAGTSYVGTIVRAVRVTLTGSTSGPIDGSGNRGEFTLTETVEFRR